MTTPTEHQFNGLIEDLKVQQAEVLRLRQALFLATVANTDKTWVWQGKGHNNLSSLTCPIVITPEDLITLLSRVRQEGFKIGLNESGNVRDQDWCKGLNRAFANIDRPAIIEHLNAMVVFANRPRRNALPKMAGLFLDLCDRDFDLGELYA